MKVSDWIADAKAKLARISGDSALLEAQVLLYSAIQKDRVWLLTHSNDDLGAQVELANLMLDRRLRREPLAYITGVREFFGREFKVSPATLIPRQETELLVELALEWLTKNESATTAIDIGTGTGCIAISIERTVRRMDMTAIDISPDALEMAHRNSEILGSDVKFSLQDIFHTWQLGSFDLVVSNPPYVEESASLEPELLEFEPLKALFSGAEGLNHIIRLEALFNQMVNEQGVMMIEHGSQQRKAINEIFAAYETQNFKDLAGCDRVTVIRRAQT